jgi:hypothetical protein
MSESICPLLCKSFSKLNLFYPKGQEGDPPVQLTEINPDTTSESAAFSIPTCIPISHERQFRRVPASKDFCIDP